MRLLIFVALGLMGQLAIAGGIHHLQISGAQAQGLFEEIYDSGVEWSMCFDTEVGKSYTYFKNRQVACWQLVQEEKENETMCFMNFYRGELIPPDWTVLPCDF